MPWVANRSPKRVRPVITMVGHSFRTLDRESLVFASLDAARAGTLQGLDYMDVTQQDVNVEILGGLCETFLGNATVQYKIVGCAVEPVLLADPDAATAQSEVRAIYSVPAHHIEVRVTNIYGHDMATMLLKDSPIARDLTNVDGLESETEAVNADDTFGNVGAEDEVDEVQEDLDVFRFVYPGLLNVRPEILDGKDKATTSCEYLYKADNPESTSFHVVKSTEEFDLKLHMRALILPDTEDEESYCDIVDESAQLVLSNKIGLVPEEDPVDKEFVDRLGIDVSSGSLYTKCTTQMCFLKPDKPSLRGEEEVTGSHTTVRLRAGCVVLFVIVFIIELSQTKFPQHTTIQQWRQRLAGEAC